MMFPSVLPSAPTITVGVNDSVPVPTKYPQMRYKICDEGKFKTPFSVMSIKIAGYENDEMR
jgi:hypothetical protein